MISICKRFGFEAAHFLPKVSDGHPCKRLHGHSYSLEVFVKGELDSALGWIMDFSEIKQKADPVLKILDHHLLNEIPGLENPTAENLCVWISQKLAIPGMYKLVLNETESSACVLEIN